MNEFIAFLGILVGVLIRTMVPALRKALETSPEEPFKWDHRYTVTAASAVILAFLVAIMAYPRYAPPEDGALITFIEALGFGAGLNGLINEASQWLILSPS